MSSYLTKKLLAFVVIATIFGFGAPSASANHIDFFDAGPFSITAASGQTTTTTVTGIPTASTLGGQRVVTLTSVNGLVVAGLTPLFDGEDDDGLLFGAGGNNSQANLMIQIGAGGDLNANFIDIPNSTNDWNSVRVAFGTQTGLESSAATVTVSLFATGAGTATLTRNFAGGIGNVDFLYSDFMANNPLFTMDVLRSVDRATLSIQGVLNGEYSLDSFNRNISAQQQQPIPEPTTMLLLGTGLAGVAARMRKRRKTDS